MYGTKIHRDNTGREYAKCSKCHKEATEFRGIIAKQPTEYIPGRFKWVCLECYANYVAGNFNIK